VACYGINLNSVSSILEFLDAIRDVVFDAVLYTASTYTVDASEEHAFAEQCTRDMQINTIGALLIGKRVLLRKGSTFIVFGDAGLLIPKPNYSSYLLSKAALDQTIKSLAIERTDTSFLNIKLGPVLPPDDRENKASFYSRNLKRVDEPVEGLIELCMSLIRIDNLGMTGCSINYDGGAYLKQRK
jgi:NAD(P)-dependent dehydrogenase (short-subunit alcohol dehydrogenase family)